MADGDAAGAARHFTDAIDILGDLAPYLRAETEHRVAIALTLDGERRLAIERLTSAYRAARRLGARPLAAASACRRALEPYVEDDWAVQAGHLAWDVRQTITHVCDAVGWFAAHLAFRSPRRLRFDFHAHRDASNAEMLDVLEAAAATLGQLARAAPADARAYHNTGMADAEGFLAMGCDEILVHGWRSAASGGEFAVPEDLAGRVLRRLLPWAPTDLAPWPALLCADGRVDLPGQHGVRGPTGLAVGAPLDEWDGTACAKLPTRPPATNGTAMPPLAPTLVTQSSASAVR